MRFIVNAATGDVRQEIDYDEFGNVTYVLNENEFFDLGFAGGIYDKDTKLVRFGARDYNVATGRWTCKDPIGFGSGANNLYEYCVNDPVNLYDKNGLWVSKGHTVLTNSAMLALGFNQNDIKAAVYWNTNVDRLSNQFGSYANAAHYMEGYELEAELLIADLYNSAVANEKEFKKSGCKGQHDLALANLGKALHTQQDRWAHSEQNAGWIKHLLNFINIGPDNPGVNASYFSNAYNSTYSLLMYFIQATSK